VEHHTTEALDAFQINLDRHSASYPKLSIEVLRAYVRALQDIGRRNVGDLGASRLALARRRRANEASFLEAGDVT
jgi:hypothetical protein